MRLPGYHELVNFNGWKDIRIEQPSNNARWCAVVFGCYDCLDWLQHQYSEKCKKKLAIAYWQSTFIHNKYFTVGGESLDGITHWFELPSQPYVRDIDDPKYKKVIVVDPISG